MRCLERNYIKKEKKERMCEKPLSVLETPVKSVTVTIITKQHKTNNYNSIL